MRNLMLTRLIPLPDLSARDLGAWRRLATQAAEPNPFFEPYVVLATVSRAAATGAQLLVVERDGEWLACVPMRRRGAPPMRALQTWCDEYCFLGTPLVERDSVREAVEALMSGAAKRHRLLVLERIALDGPIGATVQQLLQTHGYELVLERRFERGAAVRRSEPFTGSSKERSERRRNLRRLEEELGAPVTVHDRADDPEAIEDFLRLEASSWKGEAGTALASSPSDAAYLRQIATAFRNEGRLQVLELSADGGEPLAIGCNLVGGDTVFWFKTAFDERYRRFSPGAELTYAGRDDFYERGDLKLVDSCAAPESGLINRALPDRRELGTLVIGPSGLRGALARGAAKAAATVGSRR
jgi:CelD/BcsL family acetyltransferase involved in cellulose biosynthesis